MSTDFVIVAIALDRALFWRGDFEPKTPAEKISAPEDNPDYKKERDRKESGRDRTSMHPEFAAEIAKVIGPGSKFVLISAGSGKANAGEVFLEYSREKNPQVADGLIELLSADVNKLTENELLELGRVRIDKYKGSGL
jgi:hypothetical protein